MLLNTLQCTGQPPIKDYLTQNIIEHGDTKLFVGAETEIALITEIYTILTPVQLLLNF